jgi:hypothetical protein
MLFKKGLEQQIFGGRWYRYRYRYHALAGRNRYRLKWHKFVTQKDAFGISTLSTYKSRVADPHHLNADPNPAFQFNEDPDPAFHVNADPDPAFNLLRIWICILLFIKMMRIGDHLSIADPPRLHCGPQGLRCERQRPSMARF